MSVEGTETLVEVTDSPVVSPVEMEMTLPEQDDDPTPPELIPPTPPELKEDILQEDDSSVKDVPATVDLIALSAAMDADQEAEEAMMDTPEQ